MRQHDPNHVAQLAAMLLQGRHEAEPHHIKRAVEAARGILDEAFGPEPEAAEAPAQVEEIKAEA